MGKLSKPSKDLALTVLTEVGFEERLKGFKIRERTGPMPVTLYSFEEVVLLLNDHFPAIDFNHLENWIRNVMKDGELADRLISITSKRNLSDQKKTRLVRNLMGVRLLQCSRVV